MCRVLIQYASRSGRASPRKVAVHGYSSLFLFFGGVPMSTKPCLKTVGS